MFLSSLEELMWLPHQLMSTSGTMRSNMSTRQENGCFLLLCHAQIYSICTFCKERFHKLINFSVLFLRLLLPLKFYSIHFWVGSSTPAHLHCIQMHLSFVLRTQDKRREKAFSWMFPGVEVQSEGSWCVRAESWMSRSRSDGVVLFFNKCTF